MSDKIYDIIDKMNTITANDPYVVGESRNVLNNLKKEYNNERDQEQFAYELERLKGGNVVDREYYEDLQKMYNEHKKKFEELEAELKDLEDQYQKLTTDYTEEISNVYMKAIEKARNWMLFFMGTTIGCIGYIAYLVLYVK